MRFDNVNSKCIKEICKTISIEEFKKRFRKISPQYAPLAIKAFGKNIDLIQKKDLEKYLSTEKADGDKVLKLIEDMVQLYFSGKLKNYKNISEYFGDKECEEINIEDDEYVKYKNSFEQSDLTISFEDFANLHCKQSGFRKEEKKHEKTVQENKKLTADLKKAKDEIEKLKSDLNSTKSDFKKSNMDHKKELTEIKKELSENKKENLQLRKLFTVDNVKKNVSEILNYSLEGKTYDEVFQELDKKEKELFVQGEYTIVKEVLAAKFAILVSLEVESNGKKSL